MTTATTASTGFTPRSAVHRRSEGFALRRLGGALTLEAVIFALVLAVAYAIKPTARGVEFSSEVLGSISVWQMLAVVEGVSLVAALVAARLYANALAIVTSALSVPVLVIATGWVYANSVPWAVAIVAAFLVGRVVAAVGRRRAVRAQLAAPIPSGSTRELDEHLRAAPVEGTAHVVR